MLYRRLPWHRALTLPESRNAPMRWWEPDSPYSGAQRWARQRIPAAQTGGWVVLPIPWEISKTLPSQICANGQVIEPVSRIFNHSSPKFRFLLTLVLVGLSIFIPLVPFREKIYVCGLL